MYTVHENPNTHAHTHTGNTQYSSFTFNRVLCVCHVCTVSEPTNLIIVMMIIIIFIFICNFVSASTHRDLPPIAIEWMRHTRGFPNKHRDGGWKKYKKRFDANAYQNACDKREECSRPRYCQRMSKKKFDGQWHFEWTINKLSAIYIDCGRYVNFLIYTNTNHYISLYSNV